ncbi:hypothetical protein AOLI_G00123370 [Acnodon oligacanthus]
MGENWGLNRPAVCEMCVVVVADGEKAESETQRALIAELAKLCLRQSVLLCRRCYIATKFKLILRAHSKLTRTQVIIAAFLIKSLRDVCANPLLVTHCCIDVALCPLFMSLPAAFSETVLYTGLLTFDLS